jgi:hypothetical protein
MDADFSAAVLGLGLPAGVEEALRVAGAQARSSAGATAALLQAERLAPDHPAVLIALYRHHFFGHRLELARAVARRALVVGAAALGLPADWRQVPRAALPGARTDAAVRFYLFVLKACAYLGLRLGDAVEAQEALALLRALDPDDCVGAALLESVRLRALEPGDDNDPQADEAAFGAAAWARLPARGPTPEPSHG